MQNEIDRAEEMLRRIPPAAVPPDLLARLRAAAVETPIAERRSLRRGFRWAEVFAGWRGIAAAAASAAVILLVGLAWRPAAVPDKKKLSASTGIEANAVQVGHSLVASFDTVAQLPGGEPVRFRCREWRDDVVIHDDAHGVMISQSTPRVEVVPVRFETY
jgi:hypothetical protein